MSAELRLEPGFTPDPDLNGLPSFGRHPFGDRRQSLRRGVTAVVRVKNEARSLPYSLPPVLRATDAVILVDNQSTDGSADLARDLAGRMGLGGRLQVIDYPYPISRCGPEHLGTAPDSVHSLVYFNNWAFSHVRTAYSLKWDGDMVLTTDGEALVSAFCWQVGSQRVNLRLPRHPVYIEDDRVAYVDLGMDNTEHYGHPNQPGYSYVKAFEWEMLRFPHGSRNFTLPAGSCLELKHLGTDEFAHWTTPDAFATSPRTARKRLEYATVVALTAGRWADLPAVHRVEAPKGVHVLEHLDRVWFPKLPRPILSRSLSEAP